MPVRRQVAQHPKTPAETLKLLHLDHDLDVRGAVAQNANTPVETLQKLADDVQAYVRGCVAANANTPTETLQKLANDADPYVRVKVASHYRSNIKMIAPPETKQDRTMTPVTTKFQIDANGSVWAQVNESGRRFFPSNDTECARKNAITAAEQFIFEQCDFQQRDRSFERCRSVVQRLFDVAAAVRESFPVYNRDFRLHIDEHLQTVVAVFGAIVVSVAGDKFNVEMFVNFLTKERCPVCFGVTFDTVVEIVRNCDDSQIRVETPPDVLHLSELNRYVLNRCFAVSN